SELSPSEVARQIGTTTRTVQRWIVAGTLPARRVGGRWRVAFDALDAFQGRETASLARQGGSIRHLFVANRGEIARRIRRTCDRLNIRTTVPATIGPDALDLLDIPAVVAGAHQAGADAVHPGFGFLAENADFAQAVIDAGLRWVGPPPAAIRAMGDKAAARKLAEKRGVPVVPGYDDPDQSTEVLVAEAGRIGLPVLVKPAAGGGGKGMRTVRDAAGLGDALASAKREARAAFGDDRLILEKLIEGARHVEVQVLFDAHGNGVHLGERDCSLQRRHQKILEESPSPAVDSALRERLGIYALALARAVGYEGAGTCEFLLTSRGKVYFLEMNTRLQVEHPVTELVTGRDLVADQLRIAAGEPLGFAQAESDETRAAGGHAVEVRLYAEDAEEGFLPATGVIERLRWPTGEGIRVDAGIDEGDEVSGRFDPMLAKIIAHGQDRAEALDRLADALAATVILGLTTNLRFLRWVVDEPAIRDGQTRTDTLDHIWPPDDWTDRHGIPESTWVAAARVLGVDGWRLNAPPSVRLVAGDGATRTVAVSQDAGHETAHTAVEVALSGAESDAVAHVDVAGRSVAIRLAPPPDVDRAARAAESHHGGGRIEVTAPMPGSVLAVHVAPAAVISAGDPIVTLEAMKMEHVVVAPFGGTVTELAVRTADQVTRGQLLAVVEP
ncbi:MAG: biotin carboxylase N-terminal domain-containing protein, partial [Candidatus Limnocylindrales bacterium]